MRCAIYARYSTDHQKDSSIEDQVLVCRNALKRMGIQPTTVSIYDDKAASGASMHLRSGIKQLMKDAANKEIDVVIAESMSRYSRDQEDIAYIYKRLTFNEIQMSTTTRNQVSEMDVGFEGTISAQYLKDCAAQVRRGMRGNAERGKSQGGRSYGYNIVRKFDAVGEPIRGELEINEAEATIVRRVYEEYAAGLSPRAIVKKLNNEGIPPPRAKAWRMSTINGDAKRMNGILHNQKYIGFLIWNRTRAVRNPDTGKKLQRMNASKDWVVAEKPELRIISDDLWNRVQKRKGTYTTSNKSPVEARRPTRLLSGLLRCGCCNGSMSVRRGSLNGQGYRSASRYGCTNYTDTAQCSNKHTIKQPELEERVLATLKNKLLSAKNWNSFLNGYRKEKIEADSRKSSDRLATEQELAEVQKKTGHIAHAIENGLFQDTMIDRMQLLSTRELELKRILEALDVAHSAPVNLAPNLPKVFKHRVLELEQFLVDGSDLLRSQAKESIRDLISKIELQPVNNGTNWKITIHGILASIIAFGQKDQRGERVAVKMVAEDRIGLGSETDILTVTVYLRPID